MSGGTGSKYAAFPSAKTAIGKERLADYGFDHVKQRIVDALTYLVNTSAWISTGPDITFSGANDKFSITSAKIGFVNGWLVNSSGEGAGEAATYYTDLAFPNVAVTTYYVEEHPAQLPVLVELNRAGTKEYTRYQEYVAIEDYPDSVSDLGGGVLRIIVDTVLGAAGSHAGRKVRLWRTTAVTTSQADAFQEATVAYDGVNNYVDVGYFGATSPSLVIGNYKVALLGPRVTEVAGFGLHVGTITGNGPAAVPVTKDTTAQKIITTGLAGIAEVLRTDAHGSTKIRVDADSSDANEPQIEVRNASGVTVFSVDEDGDVTEGDPAQATTTKTLQTSGGNATIKNNNGSLEFDDTGTAAGIPLTTSAVPDARKATVPTNAVNPLLRQALLAAINDVADIAGGVSTYVWGTSPRLRPTYGAVTDGGGLDVDVTAMSWDYGGVHYAKDAVASAVTVTDNATRYIYYDHSGDSFGEVAALTSLTSDQILLAKIVTLAGAITSITDLRNAPVNALQLGEAILVGDDLDGGAHFTTVKAAVDFIRDYIRPGASTQRLFKIRVVGPTTEAATITIDFDGLVIEGHPGSRAKVSWTGDFNLFTLDGAASLNGFVCRDLAIGSNHAADDAGSISRSAFYVSGLCGGVVIDNIRFIKDGASSAHAFIHSDATGQLHASSVRNVQCDAASDYGIYLRAMADSVIENCVLTQGDTVQNTNGDGIRIGAGGAGAGGRFSVIGCDISAWDGKGVYLRQVSRCSVQRNYVKSTAGDGIVLDSSCDEMDVSFNRVFDVGDAATTAIGIHASSCDNSHFIGNHVKPNTGAGTIYSIRLEVGSDYNQGYGNRTYGAAYGAGPSDAGTGNNFPAGSQIDQA